MKLANILITTGCIILSSSGLDAQVWQEVDNSFMPSFSDAILGAEIGGTNQKVVTDLRNVAKDGKWRTYYANGASNASLHPASDPNALLAGAARVSNGWGSTGYWSQNYSAFTLDPGLSDAQGVRISFNVDFLTGLGSEAGIEIGVLPWNVIEQEIELRNAFDPTAQGLDSYNLKFLFGLANLETGEIYQANFSTGGSHMFDYAANDWTYRTDGNGSLMVSFELDDSDLASITDAGLGLIVETTWGGGSDNGEYYSINNLKVEKLVGSAIPESSTALLGLLGLACIIVRRRR